jgi:hypothetical protein
MIASAHVHGQVAARRGVDLEGGKLRDQSEERAVPAAVPDRGSRLRSPLPYPYAPCPFALHPRVAHLSARHVMSLAAQLRCRLLATPVLCHHPADYLNHG